MTATPRRLIMARLLLICGMMTVTTPQEQQQHVPTGIQTGPDLSGSSFASSVTYDSHSDTILITGSTFGRYFSSPTSTTTTDPVTPRKTSNCFVATLALPNTALQFEGMMSNEKLQWSTKQVLGETPDDTVQEACTMALLHPQNKDKLFVLGFSEVGGKFDPLYDADGVEEIQHYGVLLDVDILSTSSSVSKPFRIVGGRSIQQSAISYPIMASTQNEYVYIVSQETETTTRQDGNTNNQFVDDNTNATFDINNEVDPMRYFKYGDKYGMSIQKYKSSSINHGSNPSGDTDDEYIKTFIPVWGDTYFPVSVTQAITESGSRNITSVQSAHVSGIAVMNDDIMITVGSTSGDGDMFGRKNKDDTTLFDDTTLHGFVTKVRLDNGTIVPESMDGNGNVQTRGTRRIQSSADGGRVWIAGMCHHMTKDADAFYIVGATEGQLSTDDSNKFASGSSTDDDSGVDAYVMKIDVNTLEEIWIYQIKGVDSASMVRGISCAVAANEDAIWVGGVVQADGVVVHADPVSSFGGDDVFIVKLNSKSGEHILTHQIGSTEDDGLAMRGGLVLDNDDNCIVVGNTYGSMYRVRTGDEVSADNADDRVWISDIFVTTIRGRDGAISYPIAHPDFVPQPGSGSGGEGEIANVPQDIEKSSNGGNNSAIIILVLLFLIGGSIAVALYMRKRSKFNRDANTDRSKVILFLNEFDVDDIDLKHSATGGWHCSYSNDLAHGHNRRTSEQHRAPSYGGLSPLVGDRPKRSAIGSDPLLTAPLTSSSLIKQSLFMNDDDELDDDDDDNRSNYDGGNRFSESTTKHQRPGFDGLLDEYNAAAGSGGGWNDRQSDGRSSNDVWGKEIL